MTGVDIPDLWAYFCSHESGSGPSLLVNYKAPFRDVSSAFEVSVGDAAGSSAKIRQTGAQLTVGTRGDGQQTWGLSGTLYVGNNGTGQYDQQGGTVQIFGGLSVGGATQGTYNLSGGSLNVNGFYLYPTSQSPNDPSYLPTLSTAYANIGDYRGGTAIFNHSGGTFNVGQPYGSSGTTETGCLYIGASTPTAHSEYNLSGTGQLLATWLQFQGNGSTLFNQTGGSNVATTIQLTPDQGGVAQYTQNGGNTTPTTLKLSPNQGGTATYAISGGTLVAEQILVGGNGSATFRLPGGGRPTSPGGSVFVDSLTVAGQGAATCEVGRGWLEATNMSVGVAAPGALHLLGSSGHLLAQNLVLGPHATLQATSGSAITMASVDGETSSFSIQSKSATDLAGLENVRLVFKNLYLTDDFDILGDMAYCEIAGKDLGAHPTGFNNNFSLQSLVLGDDNNYLGWVTLVDRYDNSDGSAPEALYVHDIILGDFSYLDLNGLHVYYDGTLQVSDSAYITGGTLTFVSEPVPEPSTLVLLATGALSLLIPVWRRGRNR